MTGRRRHRIGETRRGGSFFFYRYSIYSEESFGDDPDADTADVVANEAVVDPKVPFIYIYVYTVYICIIEATTSTSLTTMKAETA